MTLMHSSSKRIPFWNLVRWDIRHNRILYLVFFLLTALAKPLWMAIDLANFLSVDRSSEFFNSDLAKDFELGFPYVGNTVTFGLLFLAFLVFVSLQFNFLFSKRKVDLLHAFPVTRTQWLLGRSVGGALVLGAGVLVSFILSAALYGIGCRQAGARTDFAGYTIAFSAVLSAALVLWALLLFCAVSSNTAGEYVLSLPGLLLLLPVGLVLLVLMGKSVLPGAGTSSFFLNYITPLYTGLDHKEIASAPLFWLVFLWLLAEAVFLFLISVGYYRRRKSECAEQGGSNRLLISLIEIGAALFTGLGCGLFTNLVLINRLKDREELLLGLFWTALLAGGFFAVLVVEAIFCHARIHWKPLLSVWLVTSVTAGAVYGICAGGGLGYSSQIPSAGDVESVCVDYQSDGALSKGLWDEILYGNPSVEKESIPVLTTPENIHAALRLHKAALSQQKKEKIPQITRSSERVVTITYTLRNGKQVTRQFSALKQSAQAPWMDILNSEEYKRQASFAFTVEASEIAFLLDNSVAAGRGLHPLDQAKAQALLDALKQDAFAERAEQTASINRDFVPGGAWHSYVIGLYRPGSRKALLDKPIDPNSIYNRYTMSNTLKIPYYYENTLALLQQWGILSRQVAIGQVPAEKGTILYVQSIQKYQPSKEEIEKEYPVGEYMIGNAPNGTMVSDGEAVFGTHIDESEKSIYGFLPFTNTKLLERLLEISFDNSDQAENFENHQKGYLYYFEIIGDKGEKQFTRMYFAAENQMPKEIRQAVAAQ